jgi:hypothetical protein
LFPCKEKADSGSSRFEPVNARRNLKSAVISAKFESDWTKNFLYTINTF